MRVGVLALQGGFEPHRAMLRTLGVDTCEVRSPDALREVTHLVLPGGESTTLQHLLELFGMWQLVRERHAAGALAIFGTCAGAILLGRASNPLERPPRLALLDATLERNAYGRQRESFSATVDLEGQSIEAVFIRAPRITHVGADVRVLARHAGDPVLVEGPGLLAASFHPELSRDARVHQRFLELAPERVLGL